MGLMVPRLSAAYGSGYSPEEPIRFLPEDSSNPEVAVETAGSEDFNWKHDATPSLLEADVQPFEETFPEEDGYIRIHAYSSGLQMGMYFVAVDPAWADQVIADKSLTQNGTFGNWDKYDLTDGDPTLTITCDGVTYVLSTAAHDQGSYILLWTANNDLYAAVYVNMLSNSQDDTAIMAKLCAANPGSWSTDGFELKLELY